MPELFHTGKWICRRGDRCGEILHRLLLFSRLLSQRDPVELLCEGVMRKPQVCKHQVCDHCGGCFGMVTHRWWGNKFCKRTCKNAYLREVTLGLISSPLQFRSGLSLSSAACAAPGAPMPMDQIHSAPSQNAAESGTAHVRLRLRIPSQTQAGFTSLQPCHRVLREQVAVVKSELSISWRLGRVLACSFRSC